MIAVSPPKKLVLLIGNAASRLEHVKRCKSTEYEGLVKYGAEAILKLRPLSGPDAAGAVPDA
jgi:hypothetical protein